MTGHNDIPMADFPAHVRQMHLDVDWKLELEYKVSDKLLQPLIDSMLCPFVQTLDKVLKPLSDVGRLTCNLLHNRFKNIYPCQ